MYKLWGRTSYLVVRSFVAIRPTCCLSSNSTTVFTRQSINRPPGKGCICFKDSTTTTTIPESVIQMQTCIFMPGQKLHSHRNTSASLHLTGVICFPVQGCPWRDREREAVVACCCKLHFASFFYFNDFIHGKNYLKPASPDRGRFGGQRENQIRFPLSSQQSRRFIAADLICFIFPSSVSKLQPSLEAAQTTTARTKKNSCLITG